MYKYFDFDHIAHLGSPHNMEVDPAQRSFKHLDNDEMEICVNV